MQGYYKCERCNIVIDVITSDKSKKCSKAKIPKCPHCGGKVKEIEFEDFKKAKPITFLRLIRTYNLKHIRNRDIIMMVKFL